MKRKKGGNVYRTREGANNLRGRGAPCHGDYELPS